MIDLDLCSADQFLLQRRSLKQELLDRADLQPIRIAVLSGSTTSQLISALEVFLLHSGFLPTFFEGEYGRFYEEAVHDTQPLIGFSPQIIYLHTSCYDVRARPPLDCTEAELALYVQSELSRWFEIWESLERRIGCQVIQNNFELPANAPLGNLEAVSNGGFRRFLALLNVRFAEEAARRSSLLLQDRHSIAAEIGVRQWFDWNRYFSYKLLLSPEAQLAIARSITAMVRALTGRSRKVLVLDLDNTLWGGIIGDDGVDRILIGRETPQAEAYTAFQEFCLSMSRRGILLAVCSKNEEAAAKSGFLHPDSVLKLSDIACFKANWKPKYENLVDIARELNLGLDSFVFIDDNPAERTLVRAQLPMVAVPEIGSEVTYFTSIIEAGRYFEPATLLKEDFERTSAYSANAHRYTKAAQFKDYGQYLDSLKMRAEIGPFQPVYLDRIAQLTNKTNQFNLTTKRYSLPEIEVLAKDPSWITLYGKLSDCFGDNGLISVIAGRRQHDAIHLDLWLMSCRVLKRDVELAMLDALSEQARRLDVERLIGYYLPTAKNAMVALHYEKLGFTRVPTPSGLPDGSTAWELALNRDPFHKQPRNKHIEVSESVYA